MQGIQILRVHDVNEVNQSIKFSIQLNFKMSKNILVLMELSRNKP